MLAVLIKIKFHLLSSPRIIQHEHQDYLYVHLVIKHYFQATENPHGVIIHVGIVRPVRTIVEVEKGGCG